MLVIFLQTETPQGLTRGGRLYLTDHAKDAKAKPFIQVRGFYYFAHGVFVYLYPLVTY